MNEELLIKILQILIPSLLSFIFGIITTVLFLLSPKVRNISLVSKLFSIQAEKFREIIKNDYNITRLEIVDIKGRKIKKPYPMTFGIHEFKCIATYTDGSRDYFKPYWFCWERGNPRGTDVLGKCKNGQAKISHSPKHVRYTELSCWVFPPSKEKSNSHIPHDYTEFHYSD